MLKKALLLILACLAGILLAAPAEADQKAAASKMEEDMLTLINVTRNEPYLVAEALGMNPGQVFSGIPEHSPLWDRHKPVLQPIESLNQASGRHAQDMLARNYYSHISPEGKGPEQRAAEAGYRAEEIHEDMAMIVFQNFVPADKAGLEIYKQFFLDQVQLFKDGRSNIFSYNMRDLGLAFQAGKMNIDGRNRNVYLFVLQYGISSDRLVEESLMRMINTARNDYSQTLDYFGIDEVEASRALDGFSFIHLFNGLPPFVFYSSNSGFEWQSWENDPGHSDTEFSQNLTWRTRVSSDASTCEIAKAFFKDIIFKDEYLGIKILLNPHANAAIINISLEMDGHDTLVAKGRLSTALLHDQPAFLMGNVYNVFEPPEFLSVGNGLENLHMALYDHENNLISSTKTDSLGFYRLLHKKGRNTWKIFYEGELVGSGSYHADNWSKWKDIHIPE